MSQKVVDPLVLFAQWFDEAKERKDILEPTAMNLATSTIGGMPSSRMVLLKDFDDKGFVFYTNLMSIKSKQIMENPVAALCFHWMPLKKQVRVAGQVEKVSDEEADAYFASRARKSQIGAWASKQSQVIEHSMELEKRVLEYTAKFGVSDVPRPEFWSGFRVIPSRMEFWHDRAFRLHDRFEFIKDDNHGWIHNQLFP